MSVDGRLLPALGVVSAGALWGLFWLPVRYMEQGGGLTGGWPALVFFAASAAMITPWFVRSSLRDRLHPGTLLILGVSTGGAFALYVLALLYTEVVRAVLLFYITPVWSTVLARIVLRIPITPMRIAVLLTGFAGLGIILGGSGELPVPRGVGDWMALVSGMLWAIGSLLIHRGLAPGSAGQTFAFYAGGLVITLGLMPWLPETSFEVMQELTPARTNALLAGVALAAVMLPANMAILWGAERLEPARVGILLMAEVVVGVLSAAMLAGEPFSWREATGAGLVVAAGILEVAQRSNGIRRD